MHTVLEYYLDTENKVLLHDMVLSENIVIGDINSIIHVV